MPASKGRRALASMKDRNGRPKRGSEWEPINIFLERDDFSHKMNQPKSQNHIHQNFLKFANTM
jgi:hypothetical protein